MPSIELQPRIRFRSNYERMAYLMLEKELGATYAALAERVRLSHQRVEQIVKAGYSYVGLKPGCGTRLLGLKFRTKLSFNSAIPGTPEHHWKCERFEDYRPI